MQAFKKIKVSELITSVSMFFLLHLIFHSVSCALPVFMTIRPVVKEMTDCPLLRGTSQDLQVDKEKGQRIYM